MARCTPLSRRLVRVVHGIVPALVLSAQAAAQSAPPCGPGDSLLSLGKAAFFRSIERGAFAIGERTLDDLADGLGGARAAKSSSSAKRARAAVLPLASDAPLVGALTAYVESPSSEASDEAFQALLEAATRILFETPPEKADEVGRLGLVLKGGQLFNRSSIFAVADMTSEARRLKVEDSLFGSGPDLGMGNTSKMLGEAPFFKAPVIADTRNIDRNNVGLGVKTEQELRGLWFGDYRSHLAAAAPSRSAAQITEALNAGWPLLQNFWAFKRTEIFVARAQTIFGTEMRKVNERVTMENLPARDCEPKGR